MNQTRTNQGGSVAPFIVGVIILLIIALGAMFFLHKRTSTNTEKSPTISTSPSASVSPSVTPGQSSSPTPSSTRTPSPSPSPSTSVTTRPTPSTQPGSSQPQFNTGNSALPATGPSDIMPAGVIVAVLVGLTVHFVRDWNYRRSLRRDR